MSLSDVLRPRVAELGKIKIGMKSAQVRQSRAGGTYRAPEKLDHFVVTTLQRDKNDDLVPDAPLMEALKEYADPDGKLRQLPISVLSNDIDDIMQSAYVWYQGQSVAGRSDGKTLTIFFDRPKNVWLTTPITMPWKDHFKNARDAKGNLLFKLHTNFSCVIAAAQARWGGVYKFRTTSAITGEQLYGSLTHLKQLLGGVLRGMPLRLVMRPMKVTPNGISTTVYHLHVELLGTNLQAIQQQARDLLRLEMDNAKETEQLRQEYRRLLSAPGDNETPAEQAEIAGEFHPEEPEPDDLATRYGLTNAQVSPLAPGELPPAPAPAAPPANGHTANVGPAPASVTANGHAEEGVPRRQQAPAPEADTTQPPAVPTPPAPKSPKELSDRLYKFGAELVKAGLCGDVNELLEYVRVQISAGRKPLVLNPSKWPADPALLEQAMSEARKFQSGRRRARQEAADAAPITPEMRDALEDAVGATQGAVSWEDIHKHLEMAEDAEMTTSGQQRRALEFIAERVKAVVS